MSRVMSATQVRTQFGQVMREVMSKGEPAIVERRGKPVVALISLADLERLQQLRSLEISPANRAALAWLEEWRKTPDPAGPEWWEAFERELGEDPVVFGRDEPR